MTDYQSLARADAIAAGINPDVFVAQIQQESGFNPNAVSSAGAIGIAQFMPATAAGIGFDPHDPTASLKQAAFLDARNDIAYKGDYRLMLAAYNAGNGTVDNAVKASSNNWFNLLPSETQNYVTTILGTHTWNGLGVCGPLDYDCQYGTGSPRAIAANKALISNKGNTPGILQQIQDNSSKAGPGPTINDVAGSAGSDIQNAIQAAIAAVFQPFFDKLPAFGIKAGLFMAALMFAIIGLWILTRNPTNDTQSAITSQLNDAATGIGTHIGKMRG